MPPRNRTTPTTTPADPPTVDDPTVDEFVDDDEHNDLPADVDVDSWVEWEIDGTHGHGLVVEAITGTEDRPGGVRVIPFPPAVHIPASALLERED